MDDIETQIRGTSLRLRAINRQFKWTSGRKEIILRGGITTAENCWPEQAEMQGVGA